MHSHLNFLYLSAKAGMTSFFKQTCLVFTGFMAILLITSGTPPGWLISLTFIVAIVPIAWIEYQKESLNNSNPISIRTAIGVTKMKTNSASQQGNPSKSLWLNRKRTFQIGLTLGLATGIGMSALGGFSYLQLTKDSVSMRDGQLAFSKSTTTSNTVASNGGVANSGSNSQVSRDNSSNNRDNSPQITGNYNTITIVPNRDLPGFSEKGYTTPPPDLSKYSQASNFQLDKLAAGASAADQIDFGKKGIVILGKQYTSVFDIWRGANASRFVFQLDGAQKAALIQFGLPDLRVGTGSTGAYTIKIYGDGKLLWAGECQRGRDSQIVSTSLAIPDVKLLTLEITSNGQNDSNLFVTSAQLLKE
jgi:hypothetical protein